MGVSIMHTFGCILLAFAALTTGVPRTVLSHIDIYKNTFLSPSLRIAGGENATRYQFPYQASILSNDSGTFKHICGGTLITDEWVITAAHCKTDYSGEYAVALGQLQLDEDHEEVQVIPVSQFIVHPEFPGGSVVAPNDIALVQLAEPAKVSPAVQPARLPDGNDCDIIQCAVLSGWGLMSENSKYPNTLQAVMVPRISNQQCAANFTTLTGTSKPLDDTMICTGPNPGSVQGHCQGDSGGPLVSPASRKLIGVMSWGLKPCGAQAAPSVYTAVCSHLDFINTYVTFHT